MSERYYQMGWTLNDHYSEDTYYREDGQKYFIKKNTSPMIALLSVDGIVPRLRWTRRDSNGDVLIAQDFENGRTCDVDDMQDKRIPDILRRVHTSTSLKDIMERHGSIEQTASLSLYNLKAIINEELQKNKQVMEAISYLEKNIPEDATCTPCHADVHKSNWLLSDSGKLFLVDWEQSILGDPAIDVSFILYKYIPQNKWGEWLEIYGQKPTLKYRIKLKWYITLQTLIMVVWYQEKKQFSEMNEWLVFLNRIFNEFI